ncbi:MAG: hypothetical protein EBX87_00195 [Actinobacteria bacterium]|nr:hypothetical protein [Actinomycetota bacterium]
MLHREGDEPQFDLGRWRCAGFGRLARKSQRCNDSTDIDGGLQIFVPVGERFVFTTLQGDTQFFALAVE